MLSSFVVLVERVAPQATGAPRHDCDDLAKNSKYIYIYMCSMSNASHSWGRAMLRRAGVTSRPDLRHDEYVQLRVRARPAEDSRGQKHGVKKEIGMMMIRRMMKMMRRTCQDM